MFLNLILPITSIFCWLIYLFKNDLHENIYFFPILLLVPYFFLVSKIRSIWIMRKLSPFDTPITNGYIKRGLNPIFAILVEREKGSFSLHYNQNKKTERIFSVKSSLHRNITKPKDLYSPHRFLSMNNNDYTDTFGYIQLQLEKELILYAPYKGATMWRQPEYAQNILDNMMSNGVKTH